MEMTKQEWDDATADIAYTIGAELATEYGLWLCEPADALKIWPAVTRYAQRQIRLAKTELAAQTTENQS